MDNKNKEVISKTYFKCLLTDYFGNGKFNYESSYTRQEMTSLLMIIKI